MAKNIIEFSAYDADVVPYSGYDSTKTVLGDGIYKFPGATQPEYYIAPNETTFRDITQDTGIANWGDIDAIPYLGNKQWLFCLKGFATTNGTTDVAMYEFDKSNYSYTYKGEIRCTGPNTGTAYTQQGLKASLDHYSQGTVQVAGTTVTGTSTNWIEGRIPIGARIGFGSTNPANITTWYRITDYPLMNNTPSKVNNSVNCVTVDPSTGKIYIGGNFTTWDGVTRNRIARLNTNGTLDTSFNPNVGFNASVEVITLDSSGKLYVGGSFTSYDGVTANRIIKLNTDGTKDTSFDNTTGFSALVYDIKLDSLGKIWVGGNFTTYKGVSAPYLTKLNTDGSRDATYPNTANPNTTVYTIEIDNNNDVYIGGVFTQVGATVNNSRYIAKILKTGGLDATFAVGAAGTSNAFDSSVNAIYYKSSTNSIVVGGAFSFWKGVSNGFLTEISAIGNAIISSASSQTVRSLFADSLGNIYCYANSQLITKRNINTLIVDPTFTPNIIFTIQAGLDVLLALNPSNDRLYVVSGNLTVDSGLVCVETTNGTRDTTFLTSQDWKSQVITINSSAGTLPAGTPYVIEDLKLYHQRAVGSLGLYMIQGISIDDFTILPTNIATPAFNFAGLAKGLHYILDGAYITSSGFQGASVNAISGKAIAFDKINSTTHYLYVISNAGRVSRLNLKSPYINQLGTNATGTIRYSTTDQLLVTGTAINNQNGSAFSGFVSGHFCIDTMQSGSAAGIKSIYIDGSGVFQTPISTLQNEATVIYNYMAEVPPGSTNTYSAVGNVGRVYYMPEIDRLIILTSSSTGKSYITKFVNNLQQPTLISTLYGRNKFNELSIDNSYDLAFLVNGNQLQGNTANFYAPKYPDTLGTGFFGAVCDGVLHMCRPLTTIQNTIYALPMGCAAENIDVSNNAFITPKFNLPRSINISGLYVNTLKQYGTYRFNLPPEPIVIDYRISGIDDNSGTWKKYTTINELNEYINCEGTLNNLSIQFRFSFKVAGNTCLVNKIYGFSLIYEDDRTDSHYAPSKAKSDLVNRIFAWRQEELWYGNIPDLKIRLYNATNSSIVFYDTVTTSASGTWQYSTDGITWLSWNASADSIGNYIRYIADFVPAGIKLRVALNQI